MESYLITGLECGLDCCTGLYHMTSTQSDELNLVPLTCYKLHFIIPLHGRECTCVHNAQTTRTNMCHEFMVYTCSELTAPSGCKQVTYRRGILASLKNLLCHDIELEHRCQGKMPNRLAIVVECSDVKVCLTCVRNCVNWRTKQLHLLYYRPISQASLNAKFPQLHPGACFMAI